MDRTELLSEYGLTIEDIDFNIDDFSVEELKNKFDAIKKDKSDDDSSDEADKHLSDNEADEGEDPSTQSNDDSEDHSESHDDDDEHDFSLTGEQFMSQLFEALSIVKYNDAYWGEMDRYMYVDYDHDTSEVYCYDCEDWKLYGFAYSMNGDNVVIDFDSKKRKKFSIVDFDEGCADFNYKHAFEAYGNVIVAFKNTELGRIQTESDEKFNQATQLIDDLKTEVSTLKEYQKAKQSEERKNAEGELFERFAELNGIETFETLRANCAEMELNDIESKCFEIKGRNTTTNFSVNKSKPTRIVVEKKHEDEPYGGLFVQYPPR